MSFSVNSPVQMEFSLEFPFYDETATRLSRSKDKHNRTLTMIQAYRLQLERDAWPQRYIVTGNETYTAWKLTGVATIYPEHDLLWIGVARRQDATLQNL